MILRHTPGAVAGCLLGSALALPMGSFNYQRQSQSSYGATHGVLWGLLGEVLEIGMPMGLVFGPVFGAILGLAAATVLSVTPKLLGGGV